MKIKEAIAQAEAEMKVKEEQRIKDETEAKAEQEKKEAEGKAEQERKAIVWLSETGEKYHNIPDCGRMNPNKARQVTQTEAERRGMVRV